MLEYKYADNGYNDPWDKPHPSCKVRRYNRKKVKKETSDIVEDLLPAMISDHLEEYKYINFWSMVNG